MSHIFSMEFAAGDLYARLWARQSGGFLDVGDGEKGRVAGDGAAPDAEAIAPEAAVRDPAEQSESTPARHDGRRTR